MDSQLFQMALEQLDTICQKKKKKKKTQKNLDTDLRSFTKINSKWIIDLNAKCKLIKFLENAMEENLDDLGYDSDLLDLTSKQQFMKEIIKLKNLSSVKELLRR